MKTVIKPILRAFKEVGLPLSQEECVHAVGVAEVNNYIIHDPDKRTGRM